MNSSIFHQISTREGSSIPHAVRLAWRCARLGKESATPGKRKPIGKHESTRKQSEYHPLITQYPIYQAWERPGDKHWPMSPITSFASKYTPSAKTPTRYDPYISLAKKMPIHLPKDIPIISRPTELPGTKGPKQSPYQAPRPNVKTPLPSRNILKASSQPENNGGRRSVIYN